MAMTIEEKRVAARGYGLTYRTRHREEIAAKKILNKDANDAWRKQYVAENAIKIKEYLCNYYQTDKGKKSNRVSKWKRLGIINPDFDVLYAKFIATTNCELCECDLVAGVGANGRCLDHDHATGLFRNVLCKACNTRRG